MGHLAAFSFHETKNFISGEGGALVVNDPRFVERAEIIREKGTNRSKFFRGQVDKYTWVDIGSSYLPSELVAAFLYAQLEEADAITQRRFAIFNRYLEMLKPLEDEGLLRMPRWPEHCEHNAHMFYVILPTARAPRWPDCTPQEAQGIMAVFHYVPLHLSPMGRRYGYQEGSLPVTENLSERLLRLPCFFELKPAEQESIVVEIARFLRNRL